MKEKTIMDYNMIEGIVDYVIEWYHEGIAIRLVRKEIEAIAVLYDMGVDDFVQNIVETLEETPINGNGDCLSASIEETPYGYVLHVKLDDEDEEED